jgi:hypothetical protein
LKKDFCKVAQLMDLKMKLSGCWLLVAESVAAESIAAD